MSLVRSADSSAASYGDSNLYTVESSSDDARKSNQVVSHDKRNFKYGPELYCHEIYTQQYLNLSSDALPSHCNEICTQQHSNLSSDALPARQVDFLHPSNSAIPGSMFCPQGSISNQMTMGSMGSPVTMQNPYNSYSSSIRHPHPSSFANIAHCTSPLVYCDRGRPVHLMDYDEDEIRSKIQELERELLNDNDDDLLDPDQGMIIDPEWTQPIKDLLLATSPKESSSSNSNGSSSSSNKETPTIAMAAPHGAKQLLFECAAAISDGNIEEASALITKLRQMVSIQGDPPQRIAAYMVEGLVARMAASGQGLYKALKCKEPPTSDRLSAMQILFEVCPCFKFGFMAANGAIAEAFKDEARVHIIDFDINQGSQYITLIQALSTWPSKPPHLRITGVDDPESVQRSVGGLKIIGQRLEKLAEAVGLPFEFRAIPANTADVTPSTLECRPNEALVVNFAFQLHHMPDESVSTVNQRDKLLRMVKSLEPKLVTVVEQDVNTNTAPFFPRFVEAYNYYSAVFESLDATLPRGSPDRINVERHCLARDIVNIVACEGEDRIERYEAAGKWRARMNMAGFVTCPLSVYVNGAIRSLLQKSYCDRYKVKEENGALCFGWDDKILIVASAWR